MTNKGLDNSYDSKDSGTGRRGGGIGDAEADDYRPPRYVNHEPFNSGPPTYNSHDEPYDPAYNQPYEHPAHNDAPRSRDPYVGQQNTAYDGEPEQEGRRYTRGRARSNRSDRLNSSRSTDGEGDGSTVHGLGDVGLGTAI